jgi:hypothetical protein
MKKIVRLTESDLTRIVRRVIAEQEDTQSLKMRSFDATNGNKSFILIDPMCNIPFMTVKLKGKGCQSESAQGGCNAAFFVNGTSSNRAYFDGGPKPGCDRKLFNFMATAEKNDFELYFDCKKQQLYIRGNNRKLGGGTQLFEIKCDELGAISSKLCMPDTDNTYK